MKRSYNYINPYSLAYLLNNSIEMILMLILFNARLSLMIKRMIGSLLNSYVESLEDALKYDRVRERVRVEDS